MQILDTSFLLSDILSHVPNMALNAHPLSSLSTETLTRITS